MIYPPSIAILDDDAAVGRALKRMLKPLGLEIMPFTSVSSFLDAYADHDPKALLLDVQMPEMTGLELQETLRSKNRMFPIIFVTARDDEDFKQRALANGACGFLSKPFEKQAILKLLNRALHQPHTPGNVRPQSRLSKISLHLLGSLQRHHRSDPVLNELRNCPFCGANPRLDKSRYVGARGEQRYYARVVCPQCGAMTATDRSEAFTSSTLAAREASNRWNRRCL